ncbi:protein MpBHLH41 [Marchantia polymorpha subsp. ruderalis]|nr:hypothetical protein MARPO_0100s0033 [Marchantia polymorpha]BBN06947.1 hypothetical protein Mp_3g25200 [Marchantia polymorpha subsp. ruderalis]|eukprot:PTQ32325.1 hypothetical protein MARPO_0100s0033 [Marchantia polymorpha]
MEVVSTPAGNGAKQWLSELGLEEPSLVRHLDSLFLPTSNQYQSVKGYNNLNSYDLGGSFLNVKQRDASPVTMNNTFTSTGYSSQWDALLNNERPAKMPKTISWDGSFSNQGMGNSLTHQPLLPLIFSHKQQQQHHEPQIQHQQQHHQHQHNHMNQFFSPQQQLCQGIDGFVASLPKLSDDLHDSVAPRTPTMEIGGSQVLGGGAQDTCNSDVHSVEAMSMSSTCNRDSSPIADSFRGKRKPEFFPSPTDMRVQRPPPMATTRAPSPPSKATGHTQDHIMAERKRREKLSQRFIALSAIVPGLKKMDKASVLGDAIKYVKSLQDRVQKLEEQAPKKNVSSIAVVKNGKDSKGSGSDGETGAESEVVESGETPDIEARVNDKNVLIKMHCEMKIGSVAKCISELEKLHLIVLNANILSFTNTSVDLTLSAQTEDGHEVTADEIVAALQSFFKTL